MSGDQLCLEVSSLCAGYERGVPFIKDVSFKVGTGTVTGLIGANGAGKSTFLKAILGYVKPESGCVVFQGTDITGIRPDLNCGRGIGYLMEGHSVFPSLSVEENLVLGMWPRRNNRTALRNALEQAYDRAPILKERRQSNAGLLSGGQQRILEIERLCMIDPALVILDEPSLGLAPKLAEELFQRVLRFKDGGTSVILVDQNVKRVVELSDYVYVMQLGEVIMQDTGESLFEDLENIVKKFI